MESDRNSHRGEQRPVLTEDDGPLERTDRQEYSVSSEVDLRVVQVQDMTTVAAFSGSLRASSYNRSLLVEAQRLSPEGMSIDVLDVGDIPIYNWDIEQEAIPEAVIAFNAALEAVDGVLIATTEYNGVLPGSTQNLIDWASRGRNSLEGKPVAIIGGTAGGSGGPTAQMILRKTLQSLGALVMPRPTMLVGRISSRFDEDRDLIDEQVEERLQHVLEEFQRWIKRLS